MHRLLLSIVIAAAATSCAEPSRLPLAATPPADAMSGAIRGLCASDVALLGEGANHADGRSLAFKAALVRRLVDECGFDAVVFEAGSYDFLEMDRRLRRGEPVTRDMVSSAVGGLWNRNEEIQPLITWMHDSLVAGRLRLGGMDDQLGSAGAFYSISEMPAELSGLLGGERDEACRGLFRQQIYGQLGPSAEEQAPLRTCLVDIQTVVQAMPDSADRDAHLQNLENIGRFVSRQGMDTTAYIEGRSHSMWRNYQWWRAERFPQGSRVIVWGATVHLSRSARAHPRFATVANFGSYIDRTYGDRASFLGFSAASGTYMEGDQVRERAPAALGSLEAAALGDTALDLTYLDHASLRRLGALPGTVFSREPVVARWSDVVDGVVVFREERAPSRSPAH